MPRRTAIILLLLDFFLLLTEKHSRTLCINCQWIAWREALLVKFPKRLKIISLKQSFTS
ncbi:hypothetical protein [Moraxella oculi]|uniref:Uncharacterized protein n=1 Tax=Moraxella oculi TaxID=2940516 RepID=A0ABW8U6A9_9GAMM